VKEAQKTLGFAPQINLQAGLQKFVKWVVSQEPLEDQSAKAQSELTRLGLGRISA
jgi:dTDP-D-glucose 4,6-dehydratase